MAIEILSPNYILPDNDVWLLKGVPLENNYENSVLWIQGKNIDGSTITETLAGARERQFDFFIDSNSVSPRYSARHLQAFTYLREGRRYLRVDLPYAECIQYNYLIFKNKGTVSTNPAEYRYENRYYYAFITSFEYLNDKTTIVKYEIDLLQTYNFDYGLTQCFVEREHSSTDVIGENTIDENLPVGELIYVYKGNCPWLRDWSIAVASTYAWVYNDSTMSWDIYPAVGSMNGSMYTGLYIQTFTNPTMVNGFLSALESAAKIDSVVAITMVPRVFGSSGYTPQTIPTQDWLMYKDGALSISNDTDWTYNYNNKTGPRNKKLYCYPYNRLIINNNAGNVYEYKYELFSTSSTNFKINCTIVGKCEIDAIPVNYQGVEYNYNERMIIDGLPQCSWIVDSYRAWLAQNAAQRHYAYGRESVMLGAGAIATAAGAGTVYNMSTVSAGTAGTGPYVGQTIESQSFNSPTRNLPGMLGNVDNILSMLMRQYDASRMPNKSLGSNTNSLAIGEGILNFFAYNARIKPEYASIIDDYFDLYGYATHRLKVPNRDVRPIWCFVKTKGARLISLNNGIPTDVDDAIRTIYDNGIRFWKNPLQIGHYELNNSPV